VAVKKGEGDHEVVFSRVTIPRWGENITGWNTRPQRRPAPGVLICPDAWGVTGFIEAFCHRLSRHGYTCLAVEPYSRGGKPRRSDSLAAARQAFAQIPVRPLAGDLVAGLEFMRKSGDADPARIGILGIGEGGRAAVALAADTELKLRCLVLLYASVPVTPPRVPVPTLGLYGAKDDVVPPDAARAFAAIVSREGGRPELLVYPDAGHGFLDDERDTFVEASADDAWNRLLACLRANLI